MEIFSKKLPTTTVSLSRLQIFQPTRRPIMFIEKEIETSWGRAVVTGKLGQSHADVLEAVLYTAKEHGICDDGRYKVLVDPYQVKIHAALGSTTRMNDLLNDLMMAEIELDFPISKGKNCKSIGSLIEKIQDAETAIGEKLTKLNPLNGNVRSLLKIELGKVLTDIINSDVPKTRDPIQIAKLDKGICQALIRFIESQLNVPSGGWILNNLIKVVAGEISSQQMRDRKREIISRADVLKTFGITIAADRVFKDKLKTSLNNKCIKDILVDLNHTH